MPPQRRFKRCWLQRLYFWELAQLNRIEKPAGGLVSRGVGRGLGVAVGVGDEVGAGAGLGDGLGVGGGL